jgi:hypothetical protein
MSFLRSSSKVTLFHGVWVKARQLAFAADAYDKVSLSLLAINLIIARRRSGKLQIEEQETRTTALDLPEGVWEEIKLRVIDGGLEEAEQDALKRNRGVKCRYVLGERDEEEIKRNPELFEQEAMTTVVCKKWEEWGECDWCFDMRVNDSGDRKHDAEPKYGADKLSLLARQRRAVELNSSRKAC